MDKLDAVKRTSLKPIPPVILSCRDIDGRENALVVGYACNCSYDPPMIMAGIVPTRFSHHIVKNSGCFVINIADKSNRDMYDYLGKVSGRDIDKFNSLNIKTENGHCVNAPILSDCPVNIECKVVGSIMTGSHEMFITTVEKVHADKEYLDNEGNILYNKIDIL